MTIDVNGLEILERSQCLALLSSTILGRVAISVRALPAILPVTYVVIGDDIVIRASPDSTLAVALDRNVVAFEADGLQESIGRVWSVMVRGLANVVTEGAVLTSPALERLPRWGTSADGRVCAISISVITGRRSVGSVANGDTRRAWVA